MRHLLGMGLVLALAACQDYAPAEKVAHYNAEGGTVDLAHPCPDWSKSSVTNYVNENHSNFGCSVTNNMAVQLEDPADLARGHGNPVPDTEMTTHVIVDYRDGKIPVPLQPTQTGSTSQ